MTEFKFTREMLGSRRAIQVKPEYQGYVESNPSHKELFLAISEEDKHTCIALPEEQVQQLIRYLQDFCWERRIRI